MIAPSANKTNIRSRPWFGRPGAYSVNSFSMRTTKWCMCSRVTWEFNLTGAPQMTAGDCVYFDAAAPSSREVFAFRTRNNCDNRLSLSRGPSLR